MSSIGMQISERYLIIDIEYRQWSIGISDIKYRKKYWVPSHCKYASQLTCFDSLEEYSPHLMLSW
jgi:hypothetical protein